MKISRIVMGLLLIVGAGGILAGGTSAFFSDTETSTGNTFTAGAIDLLIDNDSYYNGNRCTNIGTVEAPNFVWQGTAGFPEPGTPCTTSFGLSNLDDGLLFFDFRDLKPDDEGEDTISIHVQNDAWACMDLTLTSNDDNSSSEPELEDGDVPDTVDAWDGELAGVLEFFWWADDGDNVYEVGERPLTKTGGVQNLLDLATTTGSFSITLADSLGNAWGGDDPLPANQTVYIAKAWCMGDMTLDPVAAGQGVNPSVDPGVNCDGSLLDNKTQTDGVELTIAFQAEQARHNDSFRCNPPEEGRTGTLTVNKALLVSTGGIEVNDFTLHIVGPSGDQIVTDEVPVPNLPTGSYTAYEQVTGNVGGKTFTVTFSGACTNSVNAGTSSPFTLNPNDNITCNILNNEQGDGIGD